MSKKQNINRREFMMAVGGTGLASIVASANVFGEDKKTESEKKTQQQSVTMRQIREHAFSIAKWVDPNNTMDQIIYGDPDRKVKKIGTGWVPCSQNLEAAAADGCELFISHETMFYGNWAPGMSSEESPWGRQRMNICRKHDMACMNLHNAWDNFPKYGIRDSWHSFLGLTEMVAECPYYYPGCNAFSAANSLGLYRVRPQTFREFASFVAKRCSVFRSSHGVTMLGKADTEVRMVAAGMGGHIPTLEMFQRGADVLIVTFDQAYQTTIRIPLVEMGAKLIVVEHGTSEIPGMRSMAEYLEKTFAGVKATFYCNEPAELTVRD